MLRPVGAEDEVLNLLLPEDLLLVDVATLVAVDFWVATLAIGAGGEGGGGGGGGGGGSFGAPPIHINTLRKLIIPTYPSSLLSFNMAPMATIIPFDDRDAEYPK